jgi:hypothetical protein
MTHQEHEDAILKTSEVQREEVGRKLIDGETVYRFVIVFGNDELGYIASSEEWFSPNLKGGDEPEFYDVRFQTTIYPTAAEALADALPSAIKEAENIVPMAVTDPLLPDSDCPPTQLYHHPAPSAPKSWRDDPATEKQIARLQSYGIDPTDWTKGQASDEIDKRKKEADTVRCWECGCQVSRSEAKWDGFGWYCGC